ncbi:helix-turn-helix transcriptional regulator [Pseudonocardia asaccharolytica]|uniref:AraC family transcriptional regulator n=1 Tax=Pseudonocardia asaccharolytica DSM 44247 = NBRC 16224 TaxID=1123024 RepID=A0A511D037_9PSEU|nr:helix-turn-helix transcriptional regulator [Pseudonocardia asaccharolytica]GEL18067.1 AraC family transcriptional regulator [Pseudonocardia asaccharolytica DSM 44247 = NBRC 16224]
MAESEYVRGRPHRALVRYVLGYSGYREFSPIPLRRRQAPVGSCALILSFGDPIRLHGPAGPLVPASFLAGMHDAAVITEFTGAQGGVQVDLTPLGVFTLLRRPMPELTNRTPRLDELDDAALSALPARLAEDRDWARRFARLDRYLGSRLLDDRAAHPDPEVAWAWDTLVDSDGAVPVAALAAEAGWSRRHLLTRFRDQIGLAPKPAARVLRFSRAAQLLVAGSAAADVAATCGYADQSHLVREFRALAGCTPGQYRAEQDAAAT